MNTPEITEKLKTGITPSSFSSIKELSEVEFVVPLYQRLFVWEEEQISQFLEDLESADRNNPYYIGTLTVHWLPGGESRWELVDGQQRVTALALLGACLDKKCGTSRWKPFLMKGNGDASRLWYSARDDDQKDLETIRREGPEAKDKIANANMKRFIEVFDRFIRSAAEKKMDLKDFSEFVYEKTTALVAFLPEGYKVNDLNLYFEKMNAAGKQLEPHEILKVRYFGDYSARWNAVADGSKPFVPAGAVNATAESSTGSTLESLLRGGLPAGYDRKKLEAEAAAPDPSRLVLSFPIFLLHALSICIEQEAAKAITGFWDPRNLLSTFRSTYEKWKSNGGSAEAFVKVMEDYRTWMDKWIIHLEDGLSFSPDWAGSTGPKAEDDDQETANGKDLWQFQSMLYVSGGETQRWVLEAYEENRKSPWDDKIKDGGKAHEKILALLKQQDNKLHPFDSPKWEYPHIERYWFWKLDYILWEKRESLPLKDKNREQRDAVDCYTFRSNRSIEHLHPQHPKNPNEAWQLEDLNSFGNLAMISASFNSQQGNDSVGTKFGRLGDQMANNKLESIKLLLMFIRAGSIEVGWTQDAAGKHLKEMMDHLSAYYEKVAQERT